MIVGSASLRTRTRAYLFGTLIAGAAGAGCSTTPATNPDAKGADMSVSTGQDGAAGLDESTAVLNMNGINFDDALYSTALHKLIIPGGADGNVYLVDPSSAAVTVLGGFPKPDPNADGGMMGPPDGFMFPDGFSPPDGGFRGFRQGGPTSAADGNNLLYVADRTDKNLYVVDPASQAMVGMVALATTPDFLRYVAATDEVWVSEPTKNRIEVFTLGADHKTPTHSTVIAIANGPEGLYVDKTNGVAYTNNSTMGMMAGVGMTYAIDLAKKTVSSPWANGCMRPATFAEDEANKILFVACGENGIASIDVSDPTNGKMVDRIMNASQPQIPAFSTSLRHLYLPGPSTDVVNVSKAGKFTNNGGVPTPNGESQVLADDVGNFWVLQRFNGSALRIKDPFPANVSP